MTDALVQFLRARVSEDEQAAQAARTGDRWSTYHLAGEEEAGTVRWVVGGIVEPQHVDPQNKAFMTHIARHDPARVLCDVEAKRQILEDALAEKHHVSGDLYETCPAAGAADGLDERQLEQQASINADYEIESPECAESCGRDARVQRRLRLLALLYSDHRDYREEWRP